MTDESQCKTVFRSVGLGAELWKAGDFVAQVEKLGRA